jgi:hypothetical protein
MKKRLRLPLWFFLMYAAVVQYRIHYESDLKLYRELLDNYTESLVIHGLSDHRTRPWTGHLYAMMMNRVMKEQAKLDTGVVDYGVMPGGPSVPGAGK